MTKGNFDGHPDLYNDLDDLDYAMITGRDPYGEVEDFEGKIPMNAPDVKE